MSVYKRGKTYTANVSVTTADGRKRFTKSGFRTKAEATAWSTERESLKLNNKLSKANDQPFIEYFESWAELYKSDTSRTHLEWIKITIKNTTKYLGTTPTVNIKRSELQNMFNKMGEHYSFASLKKQRTIIGQAFRSAVIDEIITNNPVENLIIVGKGKKKPELKFLEEPDMLALINLIISIPANERLATDMIIYTATQTGARFAELSGLTWNDITDSTLSITKSWDEVSHEYKPTKTTSSNRVIDVSPNLLEELNKYRPKHKTTDFIFANDHGLPITNAGANKRLSSHLTAINSSKQITFHGLRHTHASWLLSQGIDIHYVSERLGHASITMTLEVYTHLLDSTRKSEAQKSVALLSNL